MKIVFKNGSEIYVEQSIIQTLTKRLTEGCANMQSFSEPDTGKVYLMINISEISHIVQA